MKPDLIAAETAFKTQETEAKALITELKALKNSWKPEGRVKFSTADKVGDVDIRKVKELLTNIKSKGE